MARLKLLLLVLNIYFVSCEINIDSEETSTLKSLIVSSNSSDDGFFMLRNEKQFLQCMHKMCPLQKFYMMQNNQAVNMSENEKIHIALLLPSLPPLDQVNTQTLPAILPVIELAIQNVKNRNLLNGYELIVHHRDTKCSSSIGPIEAFELHYNGNADVFLGPICDYVLAPVARYAAIWQTSVISTSGLAAAFNKKVSQCQMLS